MSFNLDSKKVGVEFSNSSWEWRPLTWFLKEKMPGLFTQEVFDKCQYNDGYEVDCRTALLIASKLDVLIELGEVKQYQEEYEVMMGALPNSKCVLCGGSGNRVVSGNFRKCGVCNGSGFKDHSDKRYYFTEENVIQFRNFCRRSEGFKVT
jgi:hypothetical protein